MLVAAVLVESGQAGTGGGSEAELGGELVVGGVAEVEDGFSELGVEGVLTGEEAKLLGLGAGGGLKLEASTSFEGGAEHQAVLGAGELDRALGKGKTEAVAGKREVLNRGGFVGIEGRLQDGLPEGRGVLGGEGKDGG